MPRWFLSYHSKDEALAERLRAAIERNDPASRVFFAPSSLRTGGSWTVQLAEEIAEVAAFVLLIGEAGVGKWQAPEYYEALDRWAKSEPAFPLIVVLLEGQIAPGLPFLRQPHWIVTPDPASEKAVARIFDAAAGGGARASELWRYASPYRGLEAMGEKDSDYFFGRTRETRTRLALDKDAPVSRPVQCSPRNCARRLPWRERWRAMFVGASPASSGSSARAWVWPTFSLRLPLPATQRCASAALS